MQSWFSASPCDRNAKCLNTDGSFTCKCKQDFAGDGFKCKSTLVDEEGFRIPFFWLAVQIFISYWSKTKVIENLRKCEVGSHNCDHICSDKKYGFECSCYEGFQLSSATPNRGKCEDVNECNAGKTICGEHEFCSNLVGSYECLCKDGFKKDVLKAIGSSNFIGCVDIDECKKNPCAVNEICTNTGNDLSLTPFDLNRAFSWFI